MKLATFKVEGVSDFMFGKAVLDPKKNNETDQVREKRVWKKKVHVSDGGQLFIQPFAFKNGFESAGKWLSEKITGGAGGGGKKTYTDRFRKGILVTEKVELESNDGEPLTIKDIDPLELFVSSTGVRGSGKRVVKVFPTIYEWCGRVQIMVFDDLLTADVIERHAVAFGQFIGLGSMRVENGGINGRFRVKEFEMADM